MKRLTMVVILVCTALSHGQFLPDPAKWYRIVFLHSGQCIRPQIGSTGNAQLEQSTIAAADPSQLWKFQAGPTSGYWFIINKGGKAFDIYGTTTGSFAGTWDLHNPVENQQLFRFATSPTANYFFMCDLQSANQGTNLTLDVQGGSTAPGAQVLTWTIKTSGYENQGVRFVEDNSAPSWVAAPGVLSTNANVGIGVSSVDNMYKMQIDDIVNNTYPTVQIGPRWVAAGTQPWYLLGLYNNTSAASGHCIVNLNSANGQAGIELFRAGLQKWYIFNRPDDGAGNADRLEFYNTTSRMTLDQDGTLRVPNRIKTGDLYVTTNVWADKVFKDGYNLQPLEKVEEFIKKNKHLEGIPTEKEVKENGISVGEIQVKLLQKVEELTLHMI